MRSLSFAIAVLAGVFPSGLLAQAYTPQDAQNGAQIRAQAGASLQFLRHPCPLPDSEDVKNLFSAANARYEGIKNSVADQPFSTDLLIAEADHDYALSLVDMNCLDPADPALLESSSTALMAADQALTWLESAIATATEGAK